MFVRLSGLVVILSAAGCGGGEGTAILDPFGAVSNNGSIEGELDGEEFVVESAISTRFGPAQGSRSAAIVLSDAPDLCTMLENNELPASSKFLLIQAWDLIDGQTAVPTEPGTWPVFQNPNGQAKQAFVNYLWNEPDCDFWLTEAIGGTLELTSVDTLVFDGTAGFDTEDGDSAVANFSPEPCQSLPLLFDDTPMDCTAL